MLSRSVMSSVSQPWKGTGQEARHVRWSSDDQTSASAGIGGVAEGPHHQLVAESGIRQPASVVSDMERISLTQHPAVMEPRSPSSIAARQFNVEPTDLQNDQLAQIAQVQSQPPELSLNPSLPGPPSGADSQPALAPALPALQGPASQQALHMVWNSGTAAMQKAPHSAAAPAHPKVASFQQPSFNRLSLLLEVFLLIMITIRLARQPQMQGF